MQNAHHLDIAILPADEYAHVYAFIYNAGKEMNESDGEVGEREATRR